MYIPQHHLKNLENLIQPGKVMVVYGARQVGKTTLLRKFVEKLDSDTVLFVNGDDLIARQYLESRSIDRLKDFIGRHQYLIVDEAQYVSNIGFNLKLIVDHIPDIKVIATGSSSFDLAQNVGEPLTGRRFVLTLFPLAQMEIAAQEKRNQTAANLDTRLIYGSYPEVITMRDNKLREEYLRELVASYLFKDILALDGIRFSEKLVRLLQLLAFQIGGEVSLAEIGKQLSMSKNTVERYLDLLQKAFVIYRLSGFSRNLRKEITKNHRYYFFDVGIRNAVVGIFNPLTMRDDTGRLWENYIVSEMHKKREYQRQSARFYFWRTYDRKEIDLIEERQGRLFAYEIKWRQTHAAAPRDWRRHYPQADFNVIHCENYLNYISTSPCDLI